MQNGIAGQIWKADLNTKFNAAEVHEQHITLPHTVIESHDHTGL